MNAKTFAFPTINLLEKKYLASRIACVLFIAFLSMYLVGAPLIASLIAVIFLLLFIVQFIFQNQALNGILGGIMLLAGFYFSLAVWSEFSEFEVVTQSAKQLLLVGWSGCLTTIVLAILMLRSAVLANYMS